MRECKDYEITVRQFERFCHTYTEKRTEGLKMADYISREAVIKKIAEAQDKATTGAEDVAYYRAIKIIRDEPAADVQPIRHGRWICNEELYYNGMTMCSCCNEEYYTEDIQNLQGDLRTVNYCPNCGARMNLND